MKTKKTPFIVLLLALVFFLKQSSCISFKHAGAYVSKARITESSTKPFKIIGKSSSIASNFSLLGMFPVTPLPNIENAIFAAAGKKNADDLIDISYYLEEQYWILGKVNVLHIQGKAITYIEKTANKTKN